MEEKLAIMEIGNCEGNNHDEEDSKFANMITQLEAMKNEMESLKKEMGSLKGTRLLTFQNLYNWKKNHFQFSISLNCS
jgi:hypothetical protein